MDFHQVPSKAKAYKALCFFHLCDWSNCFDIYNDENNKKRLKQKACRTQSNDIKLLKNGDRTTVFYLVSHKLIFTMNFIRVHIWNSHETANVASYVYGDCAFIKLFNAISLFTSYENNKLYCAIWSLKFSYQLC